MEGLSEILNKLSIEDIEKLRMLFSIGSGATMKEVITLRVFCEEYKELIKSNRSENYYNSVVIALKHFVEYFGAQKSIRSITYKDVEIFMTELQKKVNKGYRVYYRTLKAAFNKAVDWNYIDMNYFVKIKLPKKNRLNPAFIDETELQRIVKHIKIDVVRDVVVFAFYTRMPQRMKMYSTINTRSPTSSLKPLRKIIPGKSTIIFRHAERTCAPWRRRGTLTKHKTVLVISRKCSDREISDFSRLTSHF